MHLLTSASLRNIFYNGKLLFFILLCIGQTACASEKVWNLEVEERQRLSSALLAGGCFWCMVGPFEKEDGVYEVISGFTGGTETDPTYQDVVRGRTSHVEAVEIYYDPKKISFSDLLSIYWQQIDPTDDQGQFADRGAHYRPAIFVKNEEERSVAEDSLEAIARSGRFSQPIVVTIEEAGPFYKAPDEHQYFYRTRSTHYNRYFEGSGRKAFLEQNWKK